MIKLASINLTQFKDYKNCSWVKRLISLSEDFFIESKVMNGCLFLEQKENRLEKSLELLNEASSVDFKYQIYKSGSIEQVKQLLAQQ
jgi:hypothetical protein